MTVKEPALFVVSTPIGNLKDITVRAMECLESVALIAAEDTRRTRKLLSHLGVKKRLISCNEYNETKKISTVISVLAEGLDVALVSDAGTPGISDPGARLVMKIRKEGFRVIPIPGPSALTCALSISGFSASSFFFAGFLPAKANDRVKFLKRLDDLEELIVFYETPHRLLGSLQDILKCFGDRRVFFAREMTKRHETYIFSNLSELIQNIHGQKILGEITLIVEGTTVKKDKLFDDIAFSELLEAILTRKRLSVKKASELVSQLTSVKKGRVYKLALQLSKEM